MDFQTTLAEFDLSSTEKEFYLHPKTNTLHRMRCGTVTRAKNKKVEIERSSKEQILMNYAEIKPCTRQECFPKLSTNDDDSSSKKKPSSGDDLSVPGHHVIDDDDTSSKKKLSSGESHVVQRHSYYVELLFCYILIIVLVARLFYDEICWENILKDVEKNLEGHTGPTHLVAKHIVKTMRAFLYQR
jgi:hypothetical protein